MRSSLPGSLRTRRRRRVPALRVSVPNCARAVCAPARPGWGPMRAYMFLCGAIWSCVVRVGPVLWSAPIWQPCELLCDEGRRAGDVVLVSLMLRFVWSTTGQHMYEIP